MTSERRCEWQVLEVWFVDCMVARDLLGVSGAPGL